MPDVRIGFQIWDSTNLNTRTYRNGDLIPQVTSPSQWTGLTTGAWCYYNNDPSSEQYYGLLYNWYAVNDPRGLAPVGYRVPQYSDWDILTDFCNLSYWGGNSSGVLKDVVTVGQESWNWVAPNLGAIDAFGFSSTPAGVRNYLGEEVGQTPGSFYGKTNLTKYWTSTQFDSSQSWWFGFQSNNLPIINKVANKKTGYSVRLIKSSTTFVSCTVFYTTGDGLYTYDVLSNTSLYLGRTFPPINNIIGQQPAVDVANTRTKLWFFNNTSIYEYDITLNPWNATYNREINVSRFDMGSSLCAIDDENLMFANNSGIYTLDISSSNPRVEFFAPLPVTGRIPNGDILKTSDNKVLLISQDYFGRYLSQYLYDPATKTGRFEFEVSIFAVNGATGLFEDNSKIYLTSAGGSVYRIQNVLPFNITLQGSMSVGIEGSAKGTSNDPDCSDISLVQPAPTPSSSRPAVTIPQCSVLIVDANKIYGLPNRNTTSILLENLSFNASDIAHTSNKMWVTNFTANTIVEYNITNSPWTATFSKNISLPNDFFLGPGLCAINNTTLLAVDTDGFYNEIVQINVSTNPATIVRRGLFLPSGRKITGDIVLTTSNKILITNDNGTNYYLTQYNNANGILEQDVEITNSTTSAYGLFVSNNQLLLIDGFGSLYQVNTTAPYTITPQNDVAPFAAGASQLPSCVTVSLTPEFPLPSPSNSPGPIVTESFTPRPTPTVTKTPRVTPTITRTPKTTSSPFPTPTPTKIDCNCYSHTIRNVSGATNTKVLYTVCMSGQPQTAEVFFGGQEYIFNLITRPDTISFVGYSAGTQAFSIAVNGPQGLWCFPPVTPTRTTTPRPTSTPTRTPRVTTSPTVTPTKTVFSNQFMCFGYTVLNPVTNTPMTKYVSSLPGGGINGLPWWRLVRSEDDLDKYVWFSNNVWVITTTPPGQTGTVLQQMISNPLPTTTTTGILPRQWSNNVLSPTNLNPITVSTAERCPTDPTQTPTPKVTSTPTNTKTPTPTNTKTPKVTKTARVSTTPTKTQTQTPTSSVGQTPTVTRTPTPTKCLYTKPTGVDSTQCGYGLSQVYVTSNTGEPSPLFKWYTAAVGGQLLQESTSRFYLAPIFTTRTFYVSEFIRRGCETPRTKVVATVSSDYDGISLSASTTVLSLGSSFDLVVTGNTPTSFGNEYSVIAISASTISGKPGLGSGLSETNTPPFTTYMNVISYYPNTLQTNVIRITPTYYGKFRFYALAYDQGGQNCVAFDSKVIDVRW